MRRAVRFLPLFYWALGFLVGEQASVRFARAGTTDERRAATLVTEAIVECRDDVGFEQDMYSLCASMLGEATSVIEEHLEREHLHEDRACACWKPGAP